MPRKSTTRRAPAESAPLTTPAESAPLITAADVLPAPASASVPAGDTGSPEIPPAAEAMIVRPQQTSLAARPVEPRTRQELAEAIFAHCDPVQIGCELLESGSEKGASVRARIFETLVEWQYGKPADAPETHLRVIWDLPCPPRELLTDADEPAK